MIDYEEGGSYEHHRAGCIAVSEYTCIHNLSNTFIVESLTYQMNKRKVLFTDYRDVIDYTGVICAILDPENQLNDTKLLCRTLWKRDIRFVFLSHKFRPAWLQWALEYECSGYLNYKNDFARAIRVIINIMNREVEQHWCAEARRYINIKDDSPSPISGITQTLLTKRQLEIFKLLAEGLSIKEIAKELGISFKSVDGHKYRIMQKLNCHDKVDLCRRAIREGWIEA